MLTEISTNLTQLFAGARLTQTNCDCTACNRTLREGEQVTIHAARQEDAPTFAIERLYCRECTPKDLTSPTLGLKEYLLHSRLTRTLDVRTQSECYTLHEITTLDTSTPNEGTAEAHDEPNEPAALIQTQTPASTVYHIDDGEGHPLCSCAIDTESTPIQLTESVTARYACPICGTTAIDRTERITEHDCRAFVSYTGSQEARR